MNNTSNWQEITLSKISTPAKALVTCIILTLALGMAGALAQIIVHDVVPTLFSDDSSSQTEMPMENPEMGEHMESETASGRGDLFSDMHTEEPETKEKQGIDQEQLVWTLKWTHIHLFGINMIFIMIGGITLFLDLGARAKTWLIVLPFIGVLIDISAMWLKAFVSPVFFWLHVPGGSAFFTIFAFVTLRALWEMWLAPQEE